MVLRKTIRGKKTEKIIDVFRKNIKNGFSS